MAFLRTNRPPVIRLFPDHADTVLWLGEPVDYSDTALAAQLVAALRAWELAYYESLDEDQAFRTKAHARAYTAAGNRLAGLLAAEVGSGLAVEFRSYEKWSRPRYFHSPMDAANPASAACFAALCEAEQARALERASVAEDGGLRAVAPLSGTELEPCEGRR
jgi:hypothetical protein